MLFYQALLYIAFIYSLFPPSFRTYPLSSVRSWQNQFITKDFQAWRYHHLPQSITSSTSLAILRNRGGFGENSRASNSSVFRRRTIKQKNKGPSITKSKSPSNPSAFRNDKILEKMEGEQDPNRLADILIRAMITSPKTASKKSASVEVDSKEPSSAPKAKIPSADFRRIVHVSQIPRKRAILCKLLVKEHEKPALARKLDVPEILYFSANITLSWRDSHSLSIVGSVEGHIGYGNNEILSPDIISTEFETLLLNNIETNDVLKFEEEKEFDDEIQPDGNIDLAEIASQYFAMEI